MYQFTEMFKDLNATQERKTYRWRGAGFGFLLGWVPALSGVHFGHFSAWFFPLFWMLAVAIGYGVGSILKK